MLDSIAAGARPLLVASVVILFPACGIAPVEDPSVLPDDVAIDRDAETNDGGPGSVVRGVAPLVLFAQPADATEVLPDVVIKLMFNEPMDLVSTTAAISIATKLGEPVAGQFAWDVGGMVVAFRPDAMLDVGAYQVVVDETATDAEGDGMDEAFYASFYVIPEPTDTKVNASGG